MITAVRLGSEPIAGLAVQGVQMPDSVLQGIANLVAIGLERARARELSAQVDAARQSEKLRTTLLDAMAHEFKTPLTSIKAATTALLASNVSDVAQQHELITIVDQEAERMKARAVAQEEAADGVVLVGRLLGRHRLDTEIADCQERRVPVFDHGPVRTDPPPRQYGATPGPHPRQRLLPRR